MKNNKKGSLMIKGINWSFYSFPDKEYVQLFGKGEVAHTQKGYRKMVFMNSDHSLPTIYHELMHSYMASLGIDSCNNITIEDYEEIVCETISYHICDILEQGKYIQKRLNAQKMEK